MSQDRNQESQAEIRVPTVSRVAGDTIIELVYDAERRRTALAVSRFGGLWNIEQELKLGDEICVPYTPTNSLIRTGSVLLPSVPEHHGDKDELLADIEAYLRRYVDLSPGFATVAAHYVLLSWVHDVFNELPYLRLQGEFGSGKTRGLMAIGSILYKPFFASGASTVSPIFHILDVFGGSLVLDEADFRFTDATSELVKILNNGSMRGLPVLRTMQNRNRELNPRAFQVFGPKLIAMRGSYQDGGLESRLLTETMVTRPIRDDIPLHLPESLREEALGLRNRLLHFRFCSLFSTKIDPALASRTESARLTQITLPLLSVAGDPQRREAMKEFIRLGSHQASERRRQSALALIVAALVAAFADSGIQSVSIGEIARRMSENRTSGTPQTDKQIGFLVRTQLKLRTRKSNGVYVVSREELPLIESWRARLVADGIDAISG